MEIIQTELAGVYEITPKLFGDHRGWFYETLNMNALDKLGLGFTIVQENQSFTAAPGTIRGLHYQKSPHAQAKIVRCIVGRIKDVAIDLRRDSPNYRKWVMVELSAENKKQLYIPKGFAHAFISLTPDVQIQYLVDDYYSPENDRSIRFDDPDISVEWGIDTPILSDKDKNAPYLRDSDCNF